MEAMWGPGFGRSEMLGVFVHETSKGFIATLAQKVCFADGLIGQRAVDAKEEGVSRRAAASIERQGR